MTGIRGELATTADNEEGYELTSAVADVDLSDTNEVSLVIRRRRGDDFSESATYYVDSIGAILLAQKLLDTAQAGFPGEENPR